MTRGKAIRKFTMWLLGLAIVFPANAEEQLPESWQKYRSLRVLYAGMEKMHREREFSKFLSQHFDDSAAIPLAKLSMESAKGYDVVIADWASQYGNDGYPKRDRSLFSPPIQLDYDFTKPVIAMTYVATRLRPNGKLNWL